MTTFKKENFITTETCNIIAALIIEKIQKRDPKVRAMIWVTWVEKFFIITGRTNLIESFDISKEINEYFEYTEDDWSPVNVIDLIKYGSKHIPTFIENQFERFSFLFTPTNDHELRIAHTNSEGKPIMSDDFFGMSLYPHKENHLVAAKVAHHLFRAHYVGTNARVDFYLDEPTPNEFIVQDDEFIVYSKDWVVKEDFANKVVDACFNGRIQDEIKEMDLYNYDFKKLAKEEGPYPWMKPTHLKDFTMI